MSVRGFKNSFMCRLAGHRRYRLAVRPHDGRCRPLTPILVTMCGRCGKELGRAVVNRSRFEISRHTETRVPANLATGARCALAVLTIEFRA